MLSPVVCLERMNHCQSGIQSDDIRISFFDQADIERRLREHAGGRGLAIDFRQTNAEAELVDFMRATAQICAMTGVSPGDGKPGYLDYLPRAWRLLNGDLAHPAMAPVRDWFDRNIPMDKRVAPRPEAQT